MTVQTFLPHPDIERSAAALDRQRLGKQRVEVVQLLMTLAGLREGWRHHPAVQMWRHHERALAAYGLAVCAEWIRRGYADGQAGVIAKLRDMFPEETASNPPWWGGGIHAAHRGALVRKDPAYYGATWPDADPAAPAVWPAGGDATPQRIDARVCPLIRATDLEEAA